MRSFNWLFYLKPKGGSDEKTRSRDAGSSEVLVTRGGDEGQVPVETAAGGTNQVTIWEMMSG